MMTSAYQLVEVVDAVEYSALNLYCVAIAFKMTEWVEQWICNKFCVKLEHSSTETIQMIQKASDMGNLWLATSSQQHTHSCTTSHASPFVQSILVKHQIIQVTQPLYSQDLAPYIFWPFPKLKSPLKGKRFLTVNEIQKNVTGQLMAIGRTVWGSKVPTLKGTEVSLSHVQCFLYLASSSINVLVFILHAWIPSGQPSYRWCIIELYNWNLYNFVNQCHPINSIKRKKPMSQLESSPAGKNYLLLGGQLPFLSTQTFHWLDETHSD